MPPKKPTREPLCYSDALKARVRKDFETTDSSIRRLAERHGIKSENTIRKWKDAEGWRRDLHAITANLVTRAIGTSAAPESPPASNVVSFNPRCATVRSGVFGPETAEDSHSDVSDQNGVIDEESAPRTDGDDAGARPVRRPSPPTQSARRLLRDQEDALDVSSAQGLAAIHSAAIRRHSALADKVMRLGELMTDSLSVILDGSSDPQESAQTLMRLVGVNASKETLAGLGKAAAQITQLGVQIQRKVLGMDIIGTPGMEPGRPAVNKLSHEVLKSLPPATLHELRAVMRARAAERPDAKVIEHIEQHDAGVTGADVGAEVQSGVDSADVAPKPTEPDPGK